MSTERALVYLRDKGYEDRVITSDESTGTVAEAAAALGVTEGEIAKSLTFRGKDGEAMLIVVAGDRRIDNSKFKATFHTKAKMLKPDEVAEEIGHEIGGVTPFGAKEDVVIYLDESLNAYDIVYPACGSSNTAAKFSVEELRELFGEDHMVDVTK
ncbi:YbaK/proline--tRNA ligase associated domain protein [Aedoeadaptatus nemausensis]|uniref:YbaK/proline--tRNA ligase associated domain protein n=1 Tax=Aedoeadaptatus nemausensis TaxID=2582829 RepID=A0A6V6Y3Q4_9FIRM|nr:YbaK/EbsC family protein [Peptoniphilus nemausensis]CAC9931399.1 YbaK/proline--tRNA ligase associated domain protein [Peptoniphilus nemausensis]